MHTVWFQFKSSKKNNCNVTKKNKKKTRTTKNNDCVRDISGLQPLDSRSVTPIAGEDGTLSSVSTLGTSAKFLGLDTKTVCFCCNCLVDFRLQGILYIYIYIYDDTATTGCVFCLVLKVSLPFYACMVIHGFIDSHTAVPHFLISFLSIYCPLFR